MDIAFLGFRFTPITLAHQELLEAFLRRYPQQLSMYTFASLFGWSVIHHYSWTIVEKDTLLISFIDDITGNRYLLQPVGALPAALQQQLLAEASVLNYPLKLFEVTKAFLTAFPDFCEHFDIEVDRDRSNYLYKASDLALLEGRAYERKRNLISQVDKVYNWTFSSLEVNHTTELLMELGRNQVPDNHLQNELQVLDTILNHFNALHLTGYMIGIDGKPVAFSIVDHLNPPTKIVFFEKADRHFKGLYQLINRETSKAIYAEGYEWINREDDLGLEGLRDAKMSYHPAAIVPYLILRYR
jgi:hypothetical protein